MENGVFVLLEVVLQFEADLTDLHLKNFSEWYLNC